MFGRLIIGSGRWLWGRGLDPAVSEEAMKQLGEEQMKQLREEQMKQWREELEMLRLEMLRSQEKKSFEKQMQRVLVEYRVNGSVSFSLSPSVNGGINMHIASHTICLRKYSSVRHPVVGMVLFSCGDNGDYVCPKSMVPERIIKMIKESNSSAYVGETELASSGYERIINMTKEPNTSAPLNWYEAGWISTMSKSKSPNAGSEFLPRESIGMINTASIPVVLPDIFHKDETCSPVSATPKAGDKGFLPNSGAYHTTATDAIGNHVTKNIFMQTASTLTEGNYHRGTDLASSGYPLVILDSQAKVNATGLFSVFSSITVLQENVVLFAANGDEMPAIFSGSVSHDRFQLNNVHYIPNAGDRIIVSGSELDKLGYLFGLGGGKCTVTDLRTSQVVGEGHLINGDYVMKYLRIPPDRVPEALPLPVEPLPAGLL